MEDGAMERRHSTDSNDSSNCSKQGDEGSGGTGRVLKPTTPKAPANALQFVKTGPCDLYKKAQEQIKKAELIKKEKQTMRSDTEEWQSNLDNWKSSRRKMQEHIIERVVEVKKFELEDHERSRRRSKTFSEMMQERGRKTSIPVYDDNSANDFSDLGLSSNGEKMTNGNSSLDDSNSDNDIQVSMCDTIKITNGNAFSPKSSECTEIKFAEVSTLEEKKDTISEKEEYTYERAIQNYVNFAETRVKSLSARSIPEEVKATGNSSPPKEPPPVPEKPRRSSAAKVDSVFSKAELYRKSVSTTDLTESNKKVALPKVNISKRRELFEKFVPEVKTPVVTRSTVDLNSSKSIKERLSFLEKNGDMNKTKSLDRPSPEVSVKDRLTNIENFKQQDSSNVKAVKSEITSTSIKDRLNNLEKSKITSSKTASSIEPPTSIKDRLSSLQSACNKEVSKTVVTKPNPDFHEKLNTFQEIEASTEEVYPLSEDTGYGYSSEDLFEAKKSRHYRHRSLDSLDVDDSPVSNETFERVQSYEDLDYCRNYPASSISGDTDREDSGIHTADVSSSVSQADDFDLHLDSNLSDDIKIAHQHPVTTAVEELKMNGTKSPTELSENVSCLRFEVPESSPTPRVYSKLDCSSPLPAILENPAEFNSPVDMPVVNTYSPFNSLTHSSQGDADSKHFSSYQPTDLNFSSHLSEPDIPRPEPRTSLPSDCDITVIEVCQPSSSPSAHSTLSSNNAHSSNDSKNFNGFDGKDVSNSSDVTLVEIEEINDTEVLEKDLLLEEEPSMIKSFPELLDQSDIVSTTNQIIALHSRDQSSEDLAPVLPPKAKDIPPPLPIPNKQNDCLVLDMTIVSDSGSVFPLSPTALEPPKEKPPPPPIENSDDDLDDVKAGLMKRMDSAKRIKKEIRLKRSSFLGLDGAEDNYVDPETELTRPPDLTALLTEERRLERQLYRQSLCSETDSNQESRDSGVELDNKPSDPWVSHSRNNSDNFGNQSTTSEEEDIMKKEREIIETLEQEEKLRKQHLGEKLAMRLREFDVVEKDSAEWQRIYGGVEINHIVHKADDQLEMIQVDSKETFNNVEKVNGEGMWYDHSSDTESVREPSYPYSPSPPVPPHRGQQSLHQAGDRHYDMRNAYNMADRQAFQPPHDRQMFQPPQVDRQLPFQTPQERQPPFQPPQERQQPFQPPQDRQPAFQPLQDRQPPFQPPQERQPAFQPPQERQPAFPPSQERQPAFQPPQERQPAFQPPQERQTFQTAERQSFQPSERQAFQQSERQGFKGEDRCGYQNTGTRHGFSNGQFPPGVIGQTPLPTPPERQSYQPPVEKQQFEQAVHFQPPVQSRIYPGSLNHDNTHNHVHRPGAYTLPYRSSYSDLLEVQSGESKDLHRRSMPELQALTRRSMPDLQQAAASRQVPPDHRRPPPPALPAKPNHLAVSAAIAPQPMSRTTKQALSAAPRSKLISNESWQVKRKPKQENCNYQHWLIQEAEHRRITEQQKRQSSGGMTAPPPPPPSSQVMPPQTQRPVGPQLQPPARPGHKPVYTSTPAPPQWTSHSKREKPLPDSIIQTLTQRMHNRKPDPNNNRRSAARYENVHYNQNEIHQEKVLSVSGKKRCSACGEELGRGAAMIIESLQLFYHIDCFKCCVCCMQLGDGLMGTDVRVRNNKLHCHNCYSSDDGAKFSCV